MALTPTSRRVDRFSRLLFVLFLACGLAPPAAADPPETASPSPAPAEAASTTESPGNTVDAADGKNEKGEGDPPEAIAPPIIDVGEVTVTTTRTEQDILKVPGNVTIIDRQTIESSGADSVPDLLRREAGVFVQNTTSNPEGFTVETRGFNNGAGNGGRTLVLIDNRRINEPDTGTPDWSFIALDNIERIEVVRGPVSAAWGDHAIGGVIHIITRHPTEDGVKVSLRGRSGTYDLDAGSVLVEGKHGAVSASAFFDDYKTHAFRERGDFRNKAGEMDLRFQLADRGQLRLKGGYHTSLRQRPGTLERFELALDRRQAEPGTEGDFSVARQRFVEAELDFRVTDFLKINLQPWHRRRTDTAALSSFSSSEFFGIVSETKSSFEVETEKDELGLLGQLQFDFDVFGQPNRLLIGGDIRQADVDSDSLFESITTSTPSFFGAMPFVFSSPQSTRTRRKDWGVFVHNDLDLHDRVTLSLGVRRDRVRIFGRDRLSARIFEVRHTAWSPRAALTVRLAEPVSAYVSYSRGIRFPNLNEAFGFFGFEPFLDPEKSNSYEVGVKVRTERVSLNAAVYYMNVQDEIFFDPFAVNPFTLFNGRNINLQRVRHRGIELSGTIRPCDWLELYGSYTYDDTKFTRDTDSGLEGFRVPITPRHRGNAGVRLFLPYGFEAGLNANYVGGRFLANDLMNANEKLPKFASYDARLAWKGELTEWLEVGLDLTAYNLTNRRYTEFGGLSTFTGAVGFFPSPDRHYVAGARITLKH